MIFLDETILDPSALVPVADYAPTVYVDLKYAGTDNFMGQAVYDFHEPMLRRGTALRLARAQELLLAQGYSLKIWDAWRPLSAQFKMWQVCPDDDYVADPTHGGSSKHNRGSAVDVTLVTAAGEDLPMPTAILTTSPPTRTGIMTNTAPRPPPMPAPWRRLWWPPALSPTTTSGGILMTATPTR